MNWNLLAGMVAIVGVTVSFFQWHVSQNYRRLQDRLRDTAEQQRKIERTLASLESRVEATREEMHRDYVRSGQLGELYKEIKHDLESVFVKLSGLSRALSEVIGELRANRLYHGPSGIHGGSGDAGNL